MNLLEQLYKSNDRWLGMAYKLCQEKETAKDLVSSLYLKIGQQLHSKIKTEQDFLFKGKEINTWYIYTVLRNEFLNFAKHENRYACYNATFDQIKNIQTDEDQDLIKATIQDYIAKFEPEDRALFSLLFLEGYTVTELNKLTGINYQLLLASKRCLVNELKFEFEMELDNKEKDCDSLDKRTKAYRDCIKSESEGLGDTIEKVTKATGIKKAVDWFSDKTGVDCGCEERKKKLNEIFSYRKKPECLTEDQYNTWHELRKRVKSYIKPDDVKLITKLYKDVFGIDHSKLCTCNKAKWREIINDLENIYKTY